jgi:hypothetical protein
MFAMEKRYVFFEVITAMLSALSAPIQKCDLQAGKIFLLFHYSYQGLLAQL